MLVTWRYRPRKSIIQSFDPRAWIIFFGCYLASTLLFWDLRYLSFFLLLALIVLFTSGIRWKEIRKAMLFIGGFILFFSFLTFLTGRGGMELYAEEYVLRAESLVLHSRMAAEPAHQQKRPCFQSACWRGYLALLS